MHTGAAQQTIFPALRYRNAREALAWLERAFDARTLVAYDAPDGTLGHAEVVIAGNVVMLGEARDDAYPVRSPRDAGALTAGLYVALPDAAAVDALHARALSAGADIASAPHDTDYGSHDFSARDLEGQHWTFGTYAPSG